MIARIITIPWESKFQVHISPLPHTPERMAVINQPLYQPSPKAFSAWSILGCFPLQQGAQKCDHINQSEVEDSFQLASDWIKSAWNCECEYIKNDHTFWFLAVTQTNRVEILFIKTKLQSLPY